MYLKLSLFFILFFSLSSLKVAPKSISNGIYRVNYTENPKVILLTKDTLSNNVRMNGFHKVIFKAKNKFVDVKTPPCGNDISWEKKGTYTFKNNMISFKHTDGFVNDRIGDSMKIVYVKSTVRYRINFKSKDTLELTHVSGTTEKSVKNTSFYRVN